MTWHHALDAFVFIVGTLTGFGIAVWVEVRSWDHRAYAFDEHCRTAGVKDRRSLLPGRWAA